MSEYSDPHFLRGEMLLRQNRHALAEQELRQCLLAHPNFGLAHTLLALALLHQEKFAAAAQEAQAGVGLEPESDTAHYVRSVVLAQARCYPEAEQAIGQAIRLNSSDPANFAQLAQIHFARGRWSEARGAAEQGLQLDPEHDSCQNLLAMALQKLGQPGLAIENLRGALRKDPDDSWTHANLGWAHVELGQHDAALQHFAEALRLEPDLEYARQGILTAMKGRYFLYRLVLAWFLAMSKLSGKFAWAIILAALVGHSYLTNLMRERPDWAPWLMPIHMAYIAFVLLTWIADPLFNWLLSLNRFGRLALSEEDLKGARLSGIATMLSLAAFGSWFYSANDAVLLACIYFLLAVLPCSYLYRAAEGWPRWAIGGIGGGLVACGLSILILVNGLDVLPQAILFLPTLGTILAVKGMAWISIGSQLATQWIAQQTPRKISRRHLKME